MMPSRRCALLFLLVGCARSSTTTSTSSDGSTSLDVTSAAKDPCSASALRLGEAKPVTRVDLPKGCRAKQPGAPSVIRSAEELEAALDCPSAERPQVDFAQQSLVVAVRSYSPATVGIDVLDDGKQVTFVSRFRQNCPDDPHPMPMDVTLSFVVSPTPRTFGEASCTVPTKCE